ncbi:MAG: glycosyltransferase family 2 protein [Prevotella sp.]|uniref:glycosyltransferase family 2 protein n=1 Tax=Paramuribaculum intestinale TaxID=2094151 RepID=UPI000D1ED31B|nr:glycosyltransferase family 2 protein [Paramuribaculum intestinale]MCX4294526.1 glycosyltransferase family 2 protein [Prevotella sp.]PWB03571.1 glycosyltransferase [Paramuribaculum intestinale]ROS89615.1 glycosyltransferase [Muribaculaceae bacterium Isolate-043 (Harlan)]WLT40857.1 glycosyltransferase [Paramuribaculum intestinale]
MVISVVISTFNSGNTLRDTLESVLRQGYRDVEVIVVDGGSSDNTMEIVREYEGRFEGRLRWISEPDRGLYDAMNKGIALATGDVVGILNSDDFYTSDDVLERVAREIDGVDAVYGDIHFVDPDDLTKCVRYYSSRSFRRWQMRLGFMPAHPSFYCRRHVYQSLGAFDLQFKVAADFEQLLRLIYVNRISTKYIPMDFVTMRTGGASTSGLQSHKAILRDHLRAYRKHGIGASVATEGLRYAYRVVQGVLYRFGVVI